MFSPEALERIGREVEKEKETIVVVEGKKDKEALTALGFKKVIAISGRSLEDIIERILSSKSREVVILTDFDKEGESMESQLHNQLSHHGIKVNHIIRNEFRSLKIHQIEELNSFTKLMEDDYNGKIGPIYNKIFNRSRILGRRNSGKARCDRGNLWSNRRALGTGS